MAKEVIVLEGVVLECFPNATFRVKIVDKDYPEMEINAHISGKMRMNYIRIIPGDRVQLEMTPYDLTKGRIIYRFKESEKAMKEDNQVKEQENKENTDEDKSINKNEESLSEGKEI